MTVINVGIEHASLITEPGSVFFGEVYPDDILIITLDTFLSMSNSLSVNIEGWTKVGDLNDDVAFVPREDPESGSTYGPRPYSAIPGAIASGFFVSAWYYVVRTYSASYSANVIVSDFAFSGFTVSTSMVTMHFRPSYSPKLRGSITTSPDIPNTQSAYRATGKVKEGVVLYFGAYASSGGPDPSTPDVNYNGAVRLSFAQTPVAFKAWSSVTNNVFPEIQFIHPGYHFYDGDEYYNYYPFPHKWAAVVIDFKKATGWKIGYV